jgi:hypothetical protein
VIFLRPAGRCDLDFHWLKSEWWKLPSALRSALPANANALIGEPDLEDPAQNEARSRILRAYRGPVLNRIPADARYRYVRLEASDLPSLYVIAVWDWFLDTGRTFELLNTLTHLRHGRGGVINGARQSIDHLQRVRETIEFIDQHPHEHSDEQLILIAVAESGPYTIIDGTHRAAALLRRHQASPTTPWNAILIESKRMTANSWHIGFSGFPQVLAGFAELAERGYIW